MKIHHWRVYWVRLVAWYVLNVLRWRGINDWRAQQLMPKKDERAQVLLREAEQAIYREARAGFHWAALVGWSDAELDLIRPELTRRGFHIDDGTHNIRWL